MPKKSLLLIMSSADPETMQQMPSTEQSAYKRLGATVFISVGMATLGMGFTLWTLTVGNSTELSSAHLMVAAIITAIGAGLYGAAIYVIDRMLIAQPLRPVVAVSPDNGGPATFRHAPVRSMWPRLLPRLLLALTIGVLVAEPLLLFTFKGAVEQRANRITSVARQAAVDDARRTMNDRLAGLSIKSPAQLDFEAIDKEVQAAEAERVKFDEEATRLRGLARAERTISTPTTVAGAQITGNPKCGSRCNGYEIEAELQEDLRDKKKVEVTALEARRAQAKTAVGTSESDRLKAYNTAKEEGEAAITRAEKASTFDAELLIRIQALEQLARSEYPFGGDPRESAPDTQSSATSETPLDTDPDAGSIAPDSTADPITTTMLSDGQDLAKSEPIFLGMTVMALTIWLVRLFFIFLDIMPVLAKVFLSLREDRPYEQEVALRDAKATADQKIRLRALNAETRLLSASIAEAKKAELDEAGGLWVDVDGRKIFVGPQGSLSVEERRLEGLDVSKRADGSWQLGSENSRASR